MSSSLNKNASFIVYMLGPKAAFTERPSPLGFTSGWRSSRASSTLGSSSKAMSTNEVFLLGLVSL